MLRGPELSRARARKQPEPPDPDISDRERHRRLTDRAYYDGYARYRADARPPGTSLSNSPPQG
eukprot:5154411-Pleurochrysis_carterae.AAC.1